MNFFSLFRCMQNIITDQFKLFFFFQCISSTELVFRDGHTSRRTGVCNQHHHHHQATEPNPASPLLFILLFLTDAFLRNVFACSVMCSSASFFFSSLLLVGKKTTTTCLQVDEMFLFCWEQQVVLLQRDSLNRNVD